MLFHLKTKSEEETSSLVQKNSKQFFHYFHCQDDMTVSWGGKRHLVISICSQYLVQKPILPSTEYTNTILQIYNNNKIKL